MVALVATKLGTPPVPLAGRPMAVLLFVQAKVAPAGTLVNVTAVVEAPAQMVTLAGTETVGGGFTVIVNVAAGPVHPLVPVTEIVPKMAAGVVLVAVKVGSEPVPLEASPIAGLLLVQLNVAPAGLLVKAATDTVAPVQTDVFAGTVTVGDILTATT